MKCSSCGEHHERRRNRLGDPAAYCHECHAAYMRAHRKRHSELSPEAKMRANARAYANVYQRKGKLVPRPCESCGASQVQKHHDDYSRPLDVRWLCKSCHCDLHAA